MICLEEVDAVAWQLVVVLLRCMTGLALCTAADAPAIEKPLLWELCGIIKMQPVALGMPLSWAET